MTKKYKVSVIAPCRNEEKYIELFLEDILNQDFPKEELEIIVVDGDSDDKTRVIIEKYRKNNPNILLLTNVKRTVPFALNMAIKASNGEFIVRMDLHSVYPKNYISTLIKNIESLDADNVGGVCKTIPANDTTLCRAIANVMSNGFGVGNSYFRIGVDEITKVDTVPFGCFRRSLFNKIGVFDEELTRNQDDEFNARIIKNGGKIFLLPSLEIKYFARDRVSKMAKMFYQYGLFKPLVNRKLGSVATVRQLIPLLFLLGVIVGGMVSFLHSAILVIYIGVLAVYFLLAILFSRKEIKEEPKQLLYLPWLFCILHLSYGWGYLRGIAKFIIFKQKTVEVKLNR